MGHVRYVSGLNTNFFSFNVFLMLLWQSDSGGPLVNLERNKLIGIVSFGNNLCGGHTGYPDVFTRISNFTQWIQDRISTVE